MTEAAKYLYVVDAITHDNYLLTRKTVDLLSELEITIYISTITRTLNNLCYRSKKFKL